MECCIVTNILTKQRSTCSSNIVTKEKEQHRTVRAEDLETKTLPEAPCRCALGTAAFELDRWCPCHTPGNEIHRCMHSTEGEGGRGEGATHFRDNGSFRSLIESNYARVRALHSGAS